MKISILKKDDTSNENSFKENNIINKSNYSSIILFSKVIVALIYAFGLGYSLFFIGDEFIKQGLIFLVLLILSYIILEYPYAFLKALFLPKVFKKDNINLQINIYTMAIDISSKISISIVRVILSLIFPFIILAIIPTIASYLLEFNMYFYVIASSSAIIATKDLIYLFLILKNSAKGNRIKLSTDEFIFYK